MNINTVLLSLNIINFTFVYLTNTTINFTENYPNIAERYM
jgi:hypothetical protein